MRNGGRFLLLAAAVLLATAWMYSASCAERVTADSVLDALAAKMMPIKALDAEYSASDSTGRPAMETKFSYKRPGMFCLEGRTGAIQPKMTVTIADGKSRGWVLDRDVVMEMNGQSIIHPVLLLSLEPGFAKEYSSSVSLKVPDFTGDDYVVDVELEKNPVIDSAVFSHVSLYVSKKDYILNRIDVGNSQGWKVVCKVKGYSEDKSFSFFPVEWEMKSVTDFLVVDAVLSNVRFNGDISDKLFKPEIPEGALVLDSDLKSVETYEAALKNNPKDVSALYNCGMALARAQEHEAARDKFSELAKLMPESGPARLMFASASLAVGDKEKAVSVCREVLGMSSIDSSIRSQAAMILAQAGEPETGIKELRKVVSAHPKDPEGYEQLMMVIGNNLDEHKKVVDLYLKATDESFGARLAALRYALVSRSNALTKKYAQSIIDDKNANSWQLGQAGRLFQAARNYGYTIQVYEKLIGMEPQFMEGYLALAEIYKRTGRKDELAAVATRLEKQKVIDPSVLVTAAEIWIQAEKQEEAVRVLEEELSLEPFKPEPYYNLAQLYIKSGDKEKVDKLLDRLMENCRPESKTFFTAGSIYQEKEDTEKAREYYRKAIVAGELDAFQAQRILEFYTSSESEDAAKMAELISGNYEDARLVFLAADSLVRMGKWDEARKATERAIELTSDPVDNWGYRFSLARLELQTGRRDEAAALLKELLKEKENAPNQRMLGNAEVMLAGLRSEEELTGEELDAYLEDLIKQVKKPGIDDRQRDVIRAALAEKGKAAIPKVLPMLNEKTAWMKVFAMRALGDIGDASAASEVRKLLTDEDPRLVIEAEKALGKMKDSDSLDKLVELMKDHKELAVRFEAANALGEIGDKQVVDTLIKMLSDENKRIIEAVAGSLAKLGDRKAVPKLTFALKTEKSVAVRIWIAEALAAFGEKEGLEFLESVLSWGEEVDVQNALLSIVNLPGEETYRILKEAMESEDPVVRKCAALVSHQKADGDVFPLLEKALGDEEMAVRYGAVVSLRELGYDPSKREEALRILKEHKAVEKEQYVLDLIDQAVAVLDALEASKTE